MKDAGIDYGLEVTNVDRETGIRYGVIPVTEVLQAWADESQPYWGESEEVEDYGEPVSWYVENEEVVAEQARDDTDIFVLRSRYFTYCAFCSPCAPGAGYLLDAREPENGIRAYCFGHDWFGEGKAPYPVFDVETGKEVKP